MNAAIAKTESTRSRVADGSLAIVAFMPTTPAAQRGTLWLVAGGRAAGTSLAANESKTPGSLSGARDALWGGRCRYLPTPDWI